MCGITGFFGPCGSEGELQALASRMTDQLVHRGPDDAGVWVDGSVGVALGFRRLSIIDVSPAGHQPMVSASGRFVIVFNGEVYNAGDLRQQLLPLGHTFRGQSDTEVMLAAISQWGLEAAVRKFVGMFAIALWDRQERVLHLIRDRIGIKPLFYGRCGSTFLFGSELKALRAHPAFNAEVNRGALALQMRHNYVPFPHSIYQGIFKLVPGTILSFSGEPGVDLPTPRAYWSLAEQGQEAFRGSEAEAIAELERLLQDSVRLRMISDVPLGAFLSGGIDSSTVVALMQAQSSRAVKTFTIGFREDNYDEAQYAKAVARHLGTDHTELYLTAGDALAVIPKLATMFDEPFSDSSQIPTYLVSALARQQVTVALSGDGGDELFGGYPRYFLARDLWQYLRFLPAPVRGASARLIRSVPAETYNRRLGSTGGWSRRYIRPGPMGRKLHRLADILACPTSGALYRELVSHWDPREIVPEVSEPATALCNGTSPRDLDGFTQKMMRLDLVTYLPEDILAKVDRSSMAVSLEARVPLLDHRVVEFALSVPVSMKIRGTEGKWLLRQVLHRYVPPAMFARPKMGFGVPIGEWLRGPLREWAEDLLAEDGLRRGGYFNPALIRSRWQEHLSGARSWDGHLWDVLVFQEWQRQWA